MDSIIFVVFITILQSVWQCDGVSIRAQLEHIAARRRESQGIPVADFMPSRRYFDFHPARSSVILGAPSMVSHLPEAEPILPGHTLIRPALDMLKSSIKFPHKDMDNGAGVYGNIDNLSIRWDGRNERVLYTGFRRMNDRDGTMAYPDSLRSDEDDDSRILFALLRKARDKNKKINKSTKLKKPVLQKTLYESIYPYKKNEKPRVIKVQHPKISSGKYFKTFLEKIRNAAKNKIKNKKKQKAQKKGSSVRRSHKKKRPRPRASAAYAYINLDDIDTRLRSVPVQEHNSKAKAVVVLHTSSEKHSSDEEEFNSESEEEEEIKLPKIYENVESDPKLTWFWNSKDTFNHINISPEAPELFELIPVKNIDNSKKWWFYHEADYEPFQKLD